MKSCPLCYNLIDDHKFDRHFALHRAPAPPLAGPVTTGITRYACGCCVTGEPAPEHCKRCGAEKGKRV